MEKNKRHKLSKSSNQIIQKWLCGNKNMAEIGREFNISRERVRQIISNYTKSQKR